MSSRIRRTVVGISAAVVLLVAAPAALAKVSPGTLTLSGQPQTSQILAWSWGLSNPGSAQQGGGGGTAKPSIQDVSLTKLVDANSIALVESVATSTHFQNVTLDFPLSARISPFVLKLELEDVLATSYSTGGSPGNQQTENVSLNFKEFKYSVGTASFSFEIT